jgi:fibronectin type 3 domain-containing protein
VFKERSGGIVYSLYANQDTGRPVGQVWLTSERNAVGSAGLALNAWSHLASTYDGSSLRLYVNGTLVSTTAVSGSLAASTGVLRIGGNGVWPEWFAGLVDEVRVYNRALSAGEIQTDMNTAVGTTADTSAPTAPANLRANSSTGTINLLWDAATDNVGVVRYDVYRSTVSGFVPSSANLLGQSTGTSYSDFGMRPGTYYYVVKAVDAAGNNGAASDQATGVCPDTTPPAVTMSSPADGSTVSGSVALSASASDDVSVAGVQFRVDGVNVGAEVTSAPHSVSWDSRTVGDGSHTISAVARDAAGNTGTASVSVTVSNAAPPPPPPPPPPASGLVAAWGFDEGTGMTVADASGKGHAGTVASTTWNATGRFGKALSFNGSSSWVTVADANDLDLTSALTVEAWVRPSALGSAWRTVLFKERAGGIVYSLYANQDTGRPVGQLWLGSERNALGPASLALNAWSHLASTYDGSNLRLYLNGTLVSTTAVSGSLAASTGVLRIGGNGVWPEWFAGLIDEVRVYNRALSAAEIQTDLSTAVG